MGRTSRAIAGIVVAGLLASGCYGPFNLTRKLHRWNGQVGDKWTNELVFVVLAWLPVYGLAALGDALIFNTIEFWGGQNPIPMAEAGNGTPAFRTRRLVRGTEEVILAYRPGPKNEELFVQQYRNGRATGSVWVERRGDMMVAMDAQGRTLFSAQTLPDGSVVVTDAQGNRQAFYTQQEAQQIAESYRR